MSGRIERIYVGVKDERKTLRNSKLLEFLQEFEFENQKGLKLESDSVTLFPVLLAILIGFGRIVIYFVADLILIIRYRVVEFVLSLSHHRQR